MSKVMQVITEDLIFHLEESETLLEGLERTGHKVEYQCRSGLCGVCRCHLLKGEVAQLDALALTGKNEILTCRTIPKSDVELVFSYPISCSEEA